MRLLAALAVAATLAVGGGCNSSTTAPRGEALAARVESTGLRLENLTDERLYHAVVDRESLALIDLNFCNTDPDSCPNRIEPHSTTTVQFAQVVGYSAQSRELVVYHWRLRPRVGASGYDAFQYEPLVVPLR